MDPVNHPKTCISCGAEGTHSYCSVCGELLDPRRISLKGLLHDIFHFFTHLEKGFAYTLQQLLLAPGTMQRRFVEGVRSRHQKPVSMFIICATINAVTRYWIFMILIRYYHSGNRYEADFFNEYMLLVYALLLPFIVLVNWLLFRKTKFNYAETGVLQLYIFSMLYIVAALISFLRLIWPQWDTAWLELPVLAVYNIITFLNFYKTSNRWLVLFKSLVMIVFVFLLVQLVEDLFIGWLTAP